MADIDLTLVQAEALLNDDESNDEGEYTGGIFTWWRVWRSWR